MSKFSRRTALPGSVAAILDDFARMYEAHAGSGLTKC